MQMRAAVIGGGPAGLAAAHELIAQGAQVHLFERSGRVGGLARSIHLWDESVDLGPHIMHGGDPAALALWGSVAGDMHHLPLRRAFWRKHQLLSYPPTPSGLVHELALPELLRCGSDYLAVRLHRRLQGEDARSWFTSRYGHRFYEVLLRGYVQKLWGDDGSGIDHSFLSGIVGVVSDGVKWTSRPPAFAYPSSGLSVAWKRLADRVAAHGAVHLDATVERVVVDRRGIAGLVVHGRMWPCEVIISTAPASALLRMMDGTPTHVSDAAANLRNRHMIVAHLLVESAHSLRHAWVFVDDGRLGVGRMSDSRFWKNQPRRRRGILTLEYWCGDGDSIWTATDAEIAARARDELRESDLLTGAIVHDVHVTRLPGALPVPKLGYLRQREVIDAHVRTVRGLHVAGRHGAFEFDSTLHSMAGGIAAARLAIRRRATRSSSLCDPAHAALRG